MKFGAVLAPEEIGIDAGATRAYAQAVEGMGFSYIDVLDHVLGADITNRPNWTGAYSSKDIFHEPMVTLGFLAGVTTTIEMFTGVLVLSQRQTALVAKQLAEVDVLSGGRLRVGVGVGWNEVEYEAMGSDFKTRGRRLTEQFAVLRELWTKESVTFHGQWHDISEASINPLPVQRPIPLWMGGSSEAALRRAGTLADGWVPTFFPLDTGAAVLEKLMSYVAESGRDPKTFPFEARQRVTDGTPEEWAQSYGGWQRLGATHFLVDTRRGNLRSVDAHVKLMEQFMQTIPNSGA